MPLIYQYAAVCLDAVCIRCPSAHTHKNYACIAMEPKVHSALEVLAFLLTHVCVRKHVARLCHVSLSHDVICQVACVYFCYSAFRNTFEVLTCS